MQLAARKAAMALQQGRRRALLKHMPSRWAPLVPAWQPLVSVRQVPSNGVQQLWLSEVETTSLATKKPRARDLRKLVEIDGPDGAGAAEIFVWAIIAPGQRAAIALSEQFGTAFDPFVDFNVRVIPFEPGGPSLFINEHSFAIGPSNCTSGVFDAFIADLRAEMAAYGESAADIDAHVAGLRWEPVPDAVQWAPAVTLLPGGRIAIQFQLDIAEPGYGWLGEERFTGLWSGLHGSGGLTLEGWSSQGAGAHGPASGPPSRSGRQLLPLVPGPTAGASRVVRVDGRAIGFATSGIASPLRRQRQALLAHGTLRRAD